MLGHGGVERFPDHALRGEFGRVDAPVEQGVVGEHHLARRLFVADRAADESFARGAVDVLRRAVAFQRDLAERGETPGLLGARGHFLRLEILPRLRARFLKPTGQIPAAVRAGRIEQAAPDAVVSGSSAMRAASWAAVVSA